MVVGVKENDPIGFGAGGAKIPLVGDVSLFGGDDFRVEVRKGFGFVDCIVVGVAVDDNDFEVLESLVVEIA